MKFNEGTWVEVTVRREGAPDVQKVGKVVEATRDYAVADCGGMRFTYSDDTFGHVHFRSMTRNDWANRRRRR